jgi:hypothetical protein
MYWTLASPLAVRLSGIHFQKDCGQAAMTASPVHKKPNQYKESLSTNSDSVILRLDRGMTLKEGMQDRDARGASLSGCPSLLIYEKLFSG